MKLIDLPAMVTGFGVGQMIVAIIEKEFGFFCLGMMCLIVGLIFVFRGKEQ